MTKVIYGYVYLIQSQMKKIKVVVPYKDMQLNKDVAVGEEFEVDDIRAMELASHPAGIIEILGDLKGFSQYDLTLPFKTVEQFHESIK